MTDPAPVERQRVWKTPPGVALCAHDDIAEPGSRGFVLQIGEAFFHGFVVRKGGETVGWVDRCPHAGFPLNWQPDAFLAPDAPLILCVMHGALFEIESGLCVSGPCAGQALRALPVRVARGYVMLGADVPLEEPADLGR